MKRFPVEIIRYIKSFLTILDIFGLPQNFEQELIQCLTDCRDDQGYILKMPSYYSKIRLTNQVDNFRFKFDCQIGDTLRLKLKKKKSQYKYILHLEEYEVDQICITLTIKPPLECHDIDKIDNEPDLVIHCDTFTDLGFIYYYDLYDRNSFCQGYCQALYQMSQLVHDLSNHQP
jgi:hypothetical protein